MNEQTDWDLEVWRGILVFLFVVNLPWLVPLVVIVLRLLALGVTGR